MRAYGSCATAITATRGIPVPTQPANRDEDHITARLERRRAFVSPIVLANPGDFTGDQLTDAGYQVSGKPAKKRKRPNRTYPTHFDHEAAVAQYVAGETSAEVGARHGVSAAAVLNAVRAAGHEVRVGRPTPKRDTGERPVQHQPRFDHEAAVAEYVAGDSSSVVAARHGVTPASIVHAVRDAGQQVRRPGFPATKGPRATTPVDEIVRRYAEQQTIPAIAAELHLGTRTVREALLRRGVTLRDDRARFSGGQNRHPEPVLRAAGRLYEEGLTRVQVAERLGVHLRVVDKGIDLVGATRRPAAHIARSAS